MATLEEICRAVPTFIEWNISMKPWDRSEIIGSIYSQAIHRIIDRTKTERLMREGEEAIRDGSEPEDAYQAFLRAIANRFAGLPADEQCRIVDDALRHAWELFQRRLKVT